MLVEHFLMIISFIFNVLFAVISFAYNIPLTDNVKFGPVCVIFLVFFIILYVMFKPFKKE